MSLLSAHNVSYAHVLGSSLIEKATFTIDPGDRIGLTGSNGCGKTTLLRMLNGDLEPTGGSIIRRKGLLMRMLERPPDETQSSGQRTREALAQVMREDADLVLLDEPTNHLDVDARDWLADWLIRKNITAILVSHDRSFLNRVTNRTLSIDRGKVRSYSGAYDFALEERKANEDRQWGEYDAQQRRISAAEQAAKARERLAAKVAQAPPGVKSSQDFYARKAAKVARTGRILRERQTLEATIGKPWQEQPIPELDFSNVQHCPHIVMHAERITAGYDEPLFQDLSFHLQREERWSLQGPNGSGKTTLLKVLMNQLPLMNGTVKWSTGARWGYYAQEHEVLNPRHTPLESCLEVCRNETAIRTMLACLKMRRELVTHRIDSLSLGERSKTAMTRLLLGGYNTLLLDEPTNHLEMEAQEALASTLKQFPGALLFVSHDRWFIEQVATHTLRL